MSDQSSRTSSPGADPLAATIGRREKVPATPQSSHITGGEAKRNGGPSLDPLECSKRPLAGAKVGMPPRRAFARLREGETQRAHVWQDSAILHRSLLAFGYECEGAIKSLSSLPNLEIAALRSTPRADGGRPRPSRRPVRGHGSSIALRTSSAMPRIVHPSAVSTSTRRSWARAS
jgi:hypothetical protein